MEPHADPIGRKTELSALESRLDAAASGVAQTVLISGEAGIGKSRLLQAASNRARARGFHILAGCGRELEQLRPFGPLADAFGCRRDASDRQCREIGELLGAPGDTPGLQFRIAELFVAQLEELSTSTPAALILDDLHWADGATLSALNVIERDAAGNPVALICSFRPIPRHGELDAFLRAAPRQRTQLTLGPLDPEAMAGLLEALIGAPAGPRLREKVGACAGNPFFVSELVRALREEGAIVLDGGRADVEGGSLPPSLRLTILGALGHLSRGAIDTLQIAAVLGSSFSLADLAVVTRRPAVELVATLSDAIRSHILVDANDRLQFRHDLVREAIYEDIPLAIRRTLHREVAVALEEDGASPLQVVEHLTIGALPGDSFAAERLLETARRERGRAIAVATQLYERALELLPQDGRFSDEVRAEAVVPLLWLGRIEEGENLARELLARTTAKHVQDNVLRSLAEAAFLHGRWSDALGYLERRSNIPGLTEDERTSIEAEKLSWTLDLTKEVVARASVLLPAGERLGGHVLCCLLDPLCRWHRIEGDIDGAIALAERAMAESSRAQARGEVTAEWDLAAWTVMYGGIMLDADRVDDALNTYQTVVSITESMGATAFYSLGHYLLGICHVAAGRYDDAVAEAETSEWLAEMYGTPAQAGLPKGLLAWIAFRRGEIAVARTYVETIGSHGPGYFDANVFGDWAQLLLAELDGDPGHALVTLRSSPYSAFDPAPDIVRIAIRHGHASTAKEITLAAEERARRSTAPSIAARALRCRGLLEEDGDVLLSAVGAYRGSPRVVEHAEAAEEAGTLLANAGRTEDAVAMLVTALETFEAVRVDRDESRVLATLRSLGVTRGRRGSRSRPSTGWEALTDSERKVVALVSEGLTNAQIAERLFISRKTVQTHLMHAYQKLQLKSRTELAVEASRNN